MLSSELVRREILYRVHCKGACTQYGAIARSRDINHAAGGATDARLSALLYDLTKILVSYRVG